MYNKTFLRAYLKDLHLIIEDRNFFATFSYPKQWKLGKEFTSEDEIRECILELIRNSEVSKIFFELYDHIEIDPNLHNSFKIYFHANNDDFLEEDRENLIGQLNFIFDN